MGIETIGYALFQSTFGTSFIDFEKMQDLLNKSNLSVDLNTYPIQTELIYVRIFAADLCSNLIFGNDSKEKELVLNEFYRNVYSVKNKEFTDSMTKRLDVYATVMRGENLQITQGVSDVDQVYNNLALKFIEFCNVVPNNEYIVWIAWYFRYETELTHKLLTENEVASSKVYSKASPIKKLSKTNIMVPLLVVFGLFLLQNIFLKNELNNFNSLDRYIRAYAQKNYEDSLAGYWLLIIFISVLIADIREKIKIGQIIIRTAGVVFVYYILTSIAFHTFSSWTELCIQLLGGLFSFLIIGRISNKPV